MSKVTIPIGFFLLFIAFSSAGVVFGQTAYPDVTSMQSASPSDSLARPIAAFVTAHAALDMFSGTVLVAQDGNIIYEGAFGEANKDHNFFIKWR